MQPDVAPSSEEKEIHTDVSPTLTQADMRTAVSPNAKENSNGVEATTSDFSQYTKHLDPHFPQRLVKASMEKQYKNFTEILKQLHINNPLLKALQQMPNFL